MNGCEYYREKISCLIDGELSPEEAAGLEEHIAVCPECRGLYEAFTAVSAALSEGMEEPPEGIAPAVMNRVRAAAAAKKRGMWIKGLCAAACLALVISVGAGAGLFGGVSGSDASGADETVCMTNEGNASFESYGAVGDTEAPADASEKNAAECDGFAAAPDTDAPAAFFTSADGEVYCVEDADGLERLKTLLTPLADARGVPQGEPDYSLSLDCGDELIVMDIYIEADTVFADAGDGPYAVAGSPDEIRAFIK